MNSHSYIFIYIYIRSYIAWLKGKQSQGLLGHWQFRRQNAVKSQPLQRTQNRKTQMFRARNQICQTWRLVLASETFLGPCFQDISRTLPPGYDISVSWPPGYFHVLASMTFPGPITPGPFPTKVLPDRIFATYKKDWENSHKSSMASK